MTHGAVTAADGDEDEGARVWEQVGRKLLRDELTNLRLELQESFHDAEMALCGDGEHPGEITPEHVIALRMALNRARERVEKQVAPVAGVEPWSDPLPQIPRGVMWELTDHPNAEGVDPREYVDEVNSDE
ncbi:hypothetical protein RBH20_09790 [Haloarcula sp. H-GB4]|uniref:hypothetical protein n=1 Tax=Haloarcula sp. H-GB4 TaxID=3069755 RepID=UPI0027B4BA83|nr:hypothetical protein [Haloarcula sp. H-GB4]MDQ2072825.1 hypothetical protein [Haloarcula sp. H-GB4]